MSIISSVLTIFLAFPEKNKIKILQLKIKKEQYLIML